MTNKQKQALLAYLGYYTGAIDGIWGSGSRTAANAFRADYGLEANDKNLLAAVSGTVSPKLSQNPADGWDDIQYFKRTEFKCKCGGRYCNGYPAEPDLKMVRIADAIRAEVGKPINVNSGLRCRQHNANVGGASASLHMTGQAADLGCPSGVSPQEMYDIADRIMGNSGGLGLYSWGIHIDSRAVKARWKG